MRHVKRVLLLILGTILIVVGLLIGLVGGRLAAMVGPSGTAQHTVGKVEGDGYALVANEFTINTGSSAIDGLGNFDVSAKSTTTNQLFMGIGPTKEVNEYLSGAARDVVSDVTDGSSRVVPIPGTRVPSDPTAQDFWLAQSQGQNPKVPLAKSGPDTTLVIMNVVPAKPVGATVALGMTSSSLFPLSLGLLILGVLLFVLGVFACVKGIRSGKKPPTAPPTMGSPVGQYATQTVQPVPPVVTPPQQTATAAPGGGTNATTP